MVGVAGEAAHLTRGVAIVCGEGDPRAAARAAVHTAAGLHVDVVSTTEGGAYIHALSDGRVDHRLPRAPASAAPWAAGVVLRDAAHLDALAHAGVVERLLERIHAVRPLVRVEVLPPGAGCLPRAPAGVERVLLPGDPAPRAGTGVGDRVRARWEADVIADPSIDGNLPAPPPDAAPARPRLAVVVLSLDGLPYTRRCIRSVLASSPADLRLVLVDNASSDGTVDWARAAAREDPRLHVVALDENRGVPGGRNAGLAALDLETVDAVAFLDNDVEVGARWWEPFAATLADRPGVGIAGEEGYVVHRDPGGVRTTPQPGRTPRACDIVVGYCMVIRSEAVVSVGPFDEEMGLFWHDDDDYCLRAQVAGWEVLRQESGRVLHYGHASSTGLAEIWRDAHAGQASDLSDRNRRHVADKLRAMLGPPRVSGLDGPLILVLGLPAETLPALAAAAGGRATPVLVTVSRDGLRPPRFDGAPWPTRPVPGGLVMAEPVPVADASVLAGRAVLVAGGAGGPARLGGVEVVPLDDALTRLRAGVDAPAATRRPWRAPPG